jgi:hypothetical protein
MSNMTQEMHVPEGVTLPRKFTPHDKILGCDANMGNFWAWAYSDVLININRAVFAEFIIGYALELTHGETRRDWDCIDFSYHGKKIEVKATGLAQRWRQGKARSAPSFDIKKKICIAWGEPDAERGAQAVRSADCYVFCIQTETDSATANVLDLSKWEFLIMATEKINEIFGDQKSVALSVLEKHCEMKNCIKKDFEGLREAIDVCLDEH